MPLRANWRTAIEDAERATQATTREAIAAVHHAEYITAFLDTHTFADSREAAMAIAAQVTREFGNVNVVWLQVQTCAAYNRRAQAMGGAA